MIVEFAHLAAILALLFCSAGLAQPLWAKTFGTGVIIDLSRLWLWVFICLGAAMLGLGLAYWQSDFTVLNVAENSHSLKPWLYKLTGLWGNHEGSILFWAFILAGYGWGMARLSPTLTGAERQGALWVMLAVLAAFLLFLLLTSNPFLRIFPAPTEGQDLNPLLQDPGLAFHPPLLYLGYVGTAVLFALAIVATAHPNRSNAILAAMRPWALLVWGFLSAGIALGSYWAYYELGWGGFWFWDPVENASLLPWLLLTALLHSLLLAERGQMRHWSILLAVGSFSLSLIGTFLVRSGILTSVHAFANDPARGFYLLLMLSLLGGCGLVFYALRAGQIIGTNARFGLYSREMGILCNGLLLCVLCATVFLGTLYPLFLDLAGGPKITIGAPYFTMTFVPLAIPLLLLMGLAGFLKYSQTPSKMLLRRVIVVAIITAITTAILWQILPLVGVWAMLLLAVAVWLIAGSIGVVFLFPRLTWRQGRMVVAHAALGITVLGMAAVSLGSAEKTLRLAPGQTASISGYNIALQQLREAARDNYGYVAAELSVTTPRGAIYTLAPEKRYYPSQQMVTTEVDRLVTLWGDVYVAIAETEAQNQNVILRIAYKPLVSFIWLGILIMALIAIIQAINEWISLPPPAHSPLHLAKAGLWYGGAVVLASIVYWHLGAPVFILGRIYAWLGT